MSEYEEIAVEEEVIEETVEEEEVLKEDTELENTEESKEVKEEETPDINSQFLEQFKITYDGADVKYESIDDLVADAQKGRNYQRVLEQRDNLKNNPAHGYIDEYMKSQGYADPTEFVKDLKTRTKADELIAKGMSEADALEEASSYVKNSLNVADVKTKEIDSFLQWHQGKVDSGIFDSTLDAQNIPQEVLDAYESGKSLKEAYSDHMLKSIKRNTEQETLSKLAKHKETSAGQLNKGTAANNKDMTVAQIDKLLNGMSSSQQNSWLDNNWKTLEKSGYFN